jgi:serine/threonine protein kinase
MSEASLQPGDEPVPGHRLTRRLGHGSGGEVWQATALGNKDVAFKIISLEGIPFRPATFHTLRHLLRLRHSHLVPWYTFWLRDPTGMLLEEADIEEACQSSRFRPAQLFLSQGLGEKSLSDRFLECKELRLPGIPGSELINYLEEAAHALDYLHTLPSEKGGPVVHGNLRPQNILLAGGVAQIVDAGLAALVGGRRSVTNAVVVMAFAAPELVTEGRVSPATDQYSLAMTYYFLRTSLLPFSKADDSIVRREKGENLLDFSRVTAKEQAALHKATAVDPAQRYPNCVALTTALRQALETAQDSVRPGLVLEPGKEIVPGHKLVRCLGRGASGEAWEAVALGQQPVILKVVPNLHRVGGRSRQQLKALRLLQHISHEHLLPLRNYWLLDRAGKLLPDGENQAGQAATLVLATARADSSLAAMLETRQAQGQSFLSARDVVPYLKQIASTLDYLNVARHLLDGEPVSLQHRNVKPANIMLVQGQAFLTDCHLARVVSEEEDCADIHQDSVGFSFQYAAPEVLKGRVTRQSDQYSLAITYYQLRTGESPFGRLGSAYETLAAQLEGRLDLQLLPEAERQVVARAAALEPAARFRNCKTFLQALEEAAGLGTEKTVVDYPILPPPPDGMFLIPGVEPVQGYRLVRLLGQGGIGQVWEAAGPGGIPTALKFIRLADRTAVQTETRALELMKRIRHPHLLGISGVWHREEFLIIALELGERSLLDMLHDAQGRGLSGIPREELLQYMTEAAEAIDFLHEARHDLGDGKPRSIQHRDVKPHNLLLVGGAVKLADFGLAKMQEKSIEAHSGHLSVAYAAPEFFRNKTALTSDQYSLAVTYCQLRGGRLPFSGNKAKLMQGHLHEAPDLSMLPPVERPVLARALAKDPRQRFPSCKALVQALNTPAEGSSPDLLPAAGKGRTVFWLFLVGLLLGAVLLFWLFQRAG